MRTHTRIVHAALVALACNMIVAAVPDAAGAAPCDVAGADAATVAGARDAVHAACSCADAGSAVGWRGCVRGALAGLTTSGLSRACASAVLRLETRSTCGRPSRATCCRVGPTGGHTTSIRRHGTCTAVGGGSACEGGPYVDAACSTGSCGPGTCGDGTVNVGEECDPPDGITCSSTCTRCPAGGCTPPSTCGDGVVEGKESCDPPNGTTCSSGCTSCAAATPGEILIGCTSGATGVYSSATASTLLIAYTDTSPGFHQSAIVKRLGNDGSLRDATPVVVDAPLPGIATRDGSAVAATANDDAFTVAWETSATEASTSYLAARQVPVSGAITGDPVVLAQNSVVGMCDPFIRGPIGLTPALGTTDLRITYRLVGCSGFEILVGVGNFFFPGSGRNFSAGPAPIVRGAHDVAAVWRNLFVESIEVPFPDYSLAASWVQPGPPTMFTLSSSFPSAAPALAAVGDTFVAIWAIGSELHATRFTRAAGPLDVGTGILLATGAAPIGEVAAVSDGAAVVVAWREDTGANTSTIRAIHLLPDGTVPDASPISVTTATGGSDLSVAASPSATLVAFTRAEAAGSSVRAVLLGH